MRAVVIRESLVLGRMSDVLEARITRRYSHQLDQQTPIEILEFEVGPHELLDVGQELASALKEPGFYAHIWSPETLYVCFPDAMVFIPKGNRSACERAIRIGEAFGVPRSQMRFAEMFDTDHPDADEN